MSGFLKASRTAHKILFTFAHVADEETRAFLGKKQHPSPAENRSEIVDLLKQHAKLAT